MKALTSLQWVVPNCTQIKVGRIVKLSTIASFIISQFYDKINSYWSKIWGQPGRAFILSGYIFNSKYCINYIIYDMINLTVRPTWLGENFPDNSLNEHAFILSYSDFQYIGITIQFQLLTNGKQELDT